MYSTIKLRTTSLAAARFHLEIGVDASNTPANFPVKVK